MISDPSGLRSLYYAEIGGIVYIGSALSALKSIAPESVCRPDVDIEAFLFRYAYLPLGKTVYVGVHELRPAHYRIYNVSDGSLEEKGIIKLESTLTGPDIINQQSLHDTLISVTQKQLRGHKKAGVLLGGFDSALVAALLVKLGVEVETFSFSYQDVSFNQPLVTELSHYLGVKHHWIDINPLVIKEGFQNYSENCSIPTIWPNYVIQTQHICKIMAEKGIRACFSGDGCDTAFMGYPSTYRRGGIYQRLPKIPFMLSLFLVRLLNISRLEYVLGHIFRVLVSLLRASSYRIEQRPLRSFQLFDPCSYSRLNRQASPNWEKYEWVIESSEQKIDGSSYERKMYFGKSLISPNRAKLTSSSDIGGFVIESPYLHPELKAFASQIPDELLRPIEQEQAKEGKFLLMSMAEQQGLLPAAIIYQKKVAAIRSPIDSWYSGQLKSYLLKLLESLPGSYDHGYVDFLLRDLWVEKIYKKHFSDDFVVSLGASLLITYATFFDHSNAP